MRRVRGTLRRRGGAVIATTVVASGLVVAPFGPVHLAAAAPPEITAVQQLNDATNPGMKPVVSGDGRWTFYSQGGSLWAYDATGPSGNKVLISQTTGGVPFGFGTLSNGEWATDLTGRFVAFTGYVDLYNPVAARPGLSTYLRDRDPDEDGVFDEPGATSTIEVGSRITNVSIAPSISADGRYVGFLQPDVSATVNSTQANRCVRAYRYDRITRQVVDLTLPTNDVTPICDPNQSFPTYWVTRVRLSGDGNTAFLETNWPALGPAPGGSFRWVVARDVNATTLEPLTFGGTTGNNNVFLLGNSDSGRFVLGWGEANGAALRLDRGAVLSDPDTTVVIPGGGPMSMSRDGRAVLQQTGGTTVLWRASGTVTLINGTSFSYGSLSSDGSVVVIDSTTAPTGLTSHGFTDTYRFEIASSQTYTLGAGLALASPTSPPAATKIPIADIPVDVVRNANLSIAAAPLGGKGVAPLGGKGVAPLGGKGAAPLGGKGAAPLGGKGAAPLGGKGVAPLGGKGVAALSGLTAVRNLPLAMIPVDGGWSARLAGTDLAGRPVQTLTLGQVIDRAPTALASVRVDKLDFRRTVLADATPAAWALGTVPVRSLVDGGNRSFCAVLFDAQATPPAMTADQFCDSKGITPTTTMFQIDLDPTKASVVATAPELHSLPIRPNLTALASGLGAPLLDLPLPALGLGISRVGDIPLVDLVVASPAVAALGLGSIGVASNVVDCTIVDCSAGTVDTLGTARTARALRTDATLRSITVELAMLHLGDVAVSLSDDVDLDDILLGTLEADQFPWEELDLVASGVQEYAPNPTTVHLTVPITVCGTDGGDCLDPVSGSVTLTLPASFRVRAGTATVDRGASVGAVTSKSTAVSTVVTVNVDGVQPGVSTLGIDLLPGFTLGTYTLGATARFAGRTATTNAVQLTITEPTDVAGTAATDTTADSDTLYVSYITTPDDVDLFGVNDPQGKIVSVWVSHFERDADVVLYGPPTASASGRSSRTAVPAVDAVPDDGADGGSTAPPAGSETTNDVPTQPGLTAVASSATAVDGRTESATALAANLVQISAYNGVTSPKPYVLRIRTEETVVPAACTYSPAFPGFSSGVAAGSFAVPAGPTQTLILTAPTRFGQQYGPTAVADLDAKLAALLAMPGMQGAVVDVGGDAAVAAALDAWNSGWCDPDAANRVVRALTSLIGRVQAAHPELRHVVIVGGDQVLPMARLADTTRLANEDSYADDVPAGPLREALRTRHYLSDDPYGDLDPVPFVDRQIFVPDLAVGRLVETPSEIGAAINAFVTSGGRLDPSSAYVSGNDFMSDGAAMAADRLEAAYVRAGAPANLLASRLIGETWTKDQLIAGLAGAGTTGLYSHFAHNRGMSAYGFNRDRTIDFDPSPDTFTPAEVASALQPSGSLPSPRLLFTMGCHAGLNVAGDTDFAEALVGTGAMFVGVTTYGFGNTVGTSLDERLLASFAGNLDGQVLPGVGPMTVGEALAQAKQDYWSGQGLYGAYDEKVLQSTVFYGLPMYRVEPTSGPVADPPVRQAPAPLTPAVVPGAAYRATAVSVASTFATITTPAGTKYVTANGDDPLSIANRPLQPRVIDEITATDGTSLLPAHGGLVTGLGAATTLTNFAATFPRPTAVAADVEPAATPTDVAFPTALVAITTASDPLGQSQATGGPRQRQYLVTVPGRFRSGTTPGVGTQDLFGVVDVQVLYSASDDVTAPSIGTTLAVTGAGGIDFTIGTRDDGVDGVTRVLVLYRTPAGWQPLDLTAPSVQGGPWTGHVPDPASPDFEYLVQSVDAAGNVATAAGKGRGVAVYVPPTTGDVMASVSDVAFTEGSGGGTTPVAALLRLDRPAPSGGLSFGFSLTAGTAAVPGDIGPSSGNVTVPQGAMAVAVPLQIVADDATEGNESATLTVTTAESGVVLSRSSATVTIVDDEQSAELTWQSSTAAVAEGGAPVTLVAQFDHPVNAPVTVSFATGSGSATVPGDLTLTSPTTVTVPAGAQSVELTVTAAHDQLHEGDETLPVTVTVDSGPAVVGSTSTVTLTVSDADPVPTASLAPTATNLEGASIGIGLTLDVASATPITLDWTASEIVRPPQAHGEATAGVDFPTSGQLVIPAGTACTLAAPCTLPVATIESDDLDALYEDFTVTLASATGAVISGTAASTLATIIEDDDVATATVTGPVEVKEGVGPLDLTLTLDHALPVDVVFDVELRADTRPGASSALVGTDVSVTGDGTVTVPAGALTTTVRLAIADDRVLEGDETFTVNASARPTTPRYQVPTGVDHLVTIHDRDPDPVLSIDATATADEGAGNVSVTVSLDKPATGDGVSFHFATAAGSATAPGDFTATSGDLTIPAGSSSTTISVPLVNDDASVEGPETFTIVLSAVVGADPMVATSTVTITDSDVATVTFVAGSVAEGTAASGRTPGAMTVQLSRTLEVDASFTLALADGSATVGVDVDAPAGAVAVPHGVSSFTVPLAIVPDDLVEGDESFTVSLAGVTGPVAGPASAAFTIVDDDTVAFSVGELTVAEGAGTANVVVTLDRAAPFPLQLSYSTQSDTATTGADFQPTSGILTVPAGATSGVVPVTLLDDAAVEHAEAFIVTVSGVWRVDAGPHTASVSIADDDLVSLSMVDAWRVESGGTVTLTVLLDRPAGPGGIGLAVATADGTATAGNDYLAQSGTLTVAAGQQSATITVSLVDDALVEPDETFFVGVTTVSGLVVSTVLSAQVTVVDDDGVTATATSPTVLENAGSAVVTVSLSAPVPVPVSLPYATQNGTAVAGSDYSARSSTLVIPAFTTSGSITVPILNDGVVEGTTPETFTVAFAAGSVTVAGPATVSIVDDESQFLAVGNAAQLEGDTTVRSLSFPLTLQRKAAADLVVSWSVVPGTASSSDLGAISGSVKIPKGKTSGTIAVPIAPDTVVEGDETFRLAVSATGAAVLASGANGTIVDDDGLTMSVPDATVMEGNAKKNMTFTVSLSGPRGEATLAVWATVAGTASAGSDFTADAGFLLFGVGETTKTVSIEIKGDRVREPTETFTLRVLSQQFGTVVAVGTIVDND